jgi:peptidoglycan/xylan/chitin deacetylase (PgdA/CDA1 family)
MNNILLRGSVVALFVASLLLPLNAQHSAQREVAITVDDLPAGAANFMTAGEIQEMTTKLVTTLRDQKVPAVGFVNESKLYKLGEVDGRINALKIWIDNGFELGNHTYSHASLNRVSLKDWEEEIVRGETVTRWLLSQRNLKLRYFRHPYLDVGRDLETRRAADAFLIGRGYRIAPVTMDAWDWMYARPYEDARRRGDQSLQKQLLDSYLSYTAQVFDYYEKFSRDLIGYEPKQVLLLHGNWLEADHIGDLLDLLRKRGYQFVTLEQALADAAYSMPDLFIGEEGTNWIDHWAITRGRPPQNTPTFPQWVIDRANALPRPSTQP